jgi:uncharacterized membrane protein
MGESRARSLAKTVAYRVVAVALLAAVTYAFTGNLGETTLVTIVFNIGGTVAYFGLERLWDGIDWGREPPTLPTGRTAAQGNVVEDASHPIGSRKRA